MEVAPRNKKCTCCENVLPIDEFRKMKKSNGHSNGTCSWCKSCERKKSLQRYKDNREHCIARNKQYKKDNAEVLKEKRKIYLARTAQHVKERYRAYCEKNKEFINKLAREYKQNNLHAKFRDLYSSRLCQKLQKTKPTGEYVGAPFKLVKEWIEYNFTEEMNWGNHGTYWQIDHVLPIASFDMSSETDVFVCFNWKNLMPLEKTLNQKKSDSIIPYNVSKQESQLINFVEDGHRDLEEEISDFLTVYMEHFVKKLCST